VPVQVHLVAVLLVRLGNEITTQTSGTTPCSSGLETWKSRSVV